ncbi:hypothetical protein OX284_014570 [Flavobacterium sp. SUN046]|uniref:hypothetical protein n=1 Tax=Flavobacterium sp. SUN046 TaxID=3002440 RepID=UPI002DB85555|nr:hypothetical protein [Flavobacterium sp. SUN046]MEC4050660.1 hypothetical protein [Flavobacterium sp. SUN046]
MADKIKLLELDIDVESIIAKSVELKTTLDKMRKDFDDMKKSGDTSSESYVKLEGSIKKLSSEYLTNQKQLQNLSQINGDYLTIQQKVNLTMDKEAVSITEARTQNSELLKIRNELNLSKADEAKLAKEINTKIDANNDFIKENVSQLEKQKIGIGDYKTAIAEAIDETGMFSGELGTLKTVYDTGLKVISPFKNDVLATASNMRNAAVGTEEMSAAQKGLTVATNVGTGAMRIFALAIAATGIGLLIIAIALLIGYLKTMDPVMDKLEQLFAGFGGVVELLENKIGDLIDSVHSVGDVISKLGNFLAHPIDSMKSLGNEMAKAAQEAANLKEREQDLADQMDINSVLNKRQESEIARLLIQAKDRSKSQAEQNKAFADADNLNREIYERNKKAADEQLNIAIDHAKKKKKLTEDEIQSLRDLDIANANAFLNSGKIKIEDYNALKKAMEDKIDVENQYNEQLDKITTKSNNAIEKQQAANEAAAKKQEEERKKALDDAATESKLRLDIFISEQGTKAKSLNEELRLNEKVYQSKLEIARKEYEASEKLEKDKLQLLLNENNAKNEYLQKQNDLVLQNAQHELELYLDANKSKLDANKFLSEELLAQEIERLNVISEAQAEYQTQRLQAGVINEQEYQDAIKAIDDQYAENKKALLDQRDQEDLDRQAINISNQLSSIQTSFDDELNLKLQQLDMQRDAELRAADKTGADKNIILKKFADAELTMRRSVEMQKLDVISGALKTAQSLFGEHTAVFKAIAIAQATIDTYKSAVSAYAAGLSVGGPAGLVLGPVSAGIAVTAGLANIAKITGVKFAEGEVDIAGPGSGTSDSIPAMISRGESVINAAATANNKDLLRAINSNAGVDFSKQLFPSVSNIYTSTSTQSIDMDLLASKIGENVMNGVKNLPIPVLPLQDFHLANNQYVQVIAGANH